MQKLEKEKIAHSTLECIYERETEVNLFYKWLFERDQKIHKDRVYQWFPELNNIHENKGSLSKAEIISKIDDAVIKFRERYADNIKTAETNIIAELPEIELGIKLLENLMGETVHFKYLVMPSVYPICPFDVKRNLFYFTIVRVAEGTVRFDGLSSTALHEISHFIFFRQIANIPNKLSDRGIHHLKEVLTPVLLQQPNILGYRKEKNICGNPESISYQVGVDGRVISIFDYVNEEYNKNPTPEGYMTFLVWLIALFEKVQPEILKRDKLYAENARGIFVKDSELNKQFVEPIKIT